MEEKWQSLLFYWHTIGVNELSGHLLPEIPSDLRGCFTLLNSVGPETRVVAYA